MNEMRPEAVHLPVQGLLSQDIPEEPLLESREGLPQRLSFIQDTLPGMEENEMFWCQYYPDPGDFEYGEPCD